MSQSFLAKSETKILVEAAGRPAGLLIFRESLKEASRMRILGKFVKAKLVSESEQDGAAVFCLTPAGYRAVGLRAPRRTGRAWIAAERTSDRHQEAAAPLGADAASAPEVARTGTKKALIVTMLGQADGATVEELMSATGWLPHTTRAALSRLRSAGQRLAKRAREDGSTAYRILADESGVDQVETPEGSEPEVARPDETATLNDQAAA